MGYYATYNLEMILSESDIVTILEQVGEEFPGLNTAIDKYGEYYEAVKWYTYEEDMKKLSKQFPNDIFKLSGEGECGRLWVQYFKNGLTQFCLGRQDSEGMITYDGYDEELLE